MAAKKGSKKTNIVPTPGYVLIKQEEVRQKTDSGIYLPDSAKDDKPLRGEVLAVGGDEVLDSGKSRKSPVNVGDTVIYKKWGGNDVKIDGEDYLFAKFEDILAVVN